MMCAALLPQYWQIYKHKEVIGISLLFVFIDMMGGVFNDLSLVFRAKFDRIAAATYTPVSVSYVRYIQVQSFEIEIER